MSIDKTAANALSAIRDKTEAVIRAHLPEGFRLSDVECHEDRELVRTYLHNGVPVLAIYPVRTVHQQDGDGASKIVVEVDYIDLRPNRSS